jgi:AraC-like DNA-binding protein
MRFRPLPELQLPPRRRLSALDAVAQPRLQRGRVMPATVARRAEIRRAALRTMADRLAERPLKVATVAAATGVSERELQLVMIEAGLRFDEELRALRMEHAARLIKRRSRLAVVAPAVGYSHPNHLREPFEARFGVSPAVLRRGELARARYEKRRRASLPESPRSLRAFEAKMKSDAAAVDEVRRRLVAA